MEPPSAGGAGWRRLAPSNADVAHIWVAREPFEVRGLGEREAGARVIARRLGRVKTKH
jgi:hypothetical protein